MNDEALTGEADNALKDVLNECWFADNGKTSDDIIVAKCDKFARIIRLLMMADLETSDNLSMMPKHLQEIVVEARKRKPIIEKEVGQQDWKSIDLQERQVLEVLEMPVEFQDVVQGLIQSYIVLPDGVEGEVVDDMVRDVIEVARQRRLLAEQGVKINMQWAEEWAQQMEKSVAAMASWLKPRKQTMSRNPRKQSKKEVSVISRLFNKLASEWPSMESDIRLCL